MLGWLFPRCPVETWEKAWTETRMRFLTEQFGIARLRRAEVVLPTDDYFPDPYEPTPDQARRLLDRVAGYMGVRPGSVGFEVIPDVRLPGAAGHYDATRNGRAVVRVAESQLDDPAKLVATLAHELAHDLLIGEGRLDPAAPDHEWVTDLLPVFLGVGVFAANAVVYEAHHSDGQTTWWTVRRQGYLPARVFGYAMALFALARGEEAPAWAAHLRLDAAAALTAGLRYVRRTGDCLFDPDAVPRRPPTAGEMADRVGTGSPSARLAALWDVREYRPAGLDCFEAVADCLVDRDPAVAADAARALVVFGPPAVPRLREALWSGSAGVRAAAAAAIGEVGSAADGVVADVCALLGDHDRAVVENAARAVGQLGTRADEMAVRRALGRLEAALVDCDYPLVEVLGRAVAVAAEDPGKAVRGYFVADAELRRAALAAVAGKG
jgi:hypothetical protein